MTEAMPSAWWIFDAAVTHLVNSFGGQIWLLDALMKMATTFGIPVMVLSVAAQWWTRANRQTTRHTLLSSGLAFLLGLGLNQVVLQFVQRLRPYEVGVSQLFVSPSADPSFPSDHATAAFAIAMTMFAFRHRWRWAYGAGAILIAVSRDYLGLHYASDILGGVATAFVAVSIVLVCFRKDMKVAQLLRAVL